MIDTNKYSDISLDIIYKEIEKGTILDYIETKAKGDIDLSIIRNGTTYPGFEKFYVEYLQRLSNAYCGSDFGINNSGLCLLLGYTNEIIQQGSGWYPSN